MRTEPLDVLLAALIYPMRAHSIVDLSNSIGWFTTIFPIFVPTEPGGRALDTVRQVKNQRKQLSANGLSYFTSKYHNHNGAQAFADHMPVETLFNYLGLYQGLERADGGFQRVPFNEGDVGLAVRRYALFEINVYVVNGSAHITVAFNQKMNHRERIEAWLALYTDELVELSQQLAKADYTLTRSDYPLLPIAYPRLDKFQSEELPQLGYPIDAIEDIYPCSPLQECVLLSQARLDGAGAYLYHAILPLDSAGGDPSRLQFAWQQVGDRHSILRTVFLRRITDQPFDQMVLGSHTARTLLLEEAVSGMDAVDTAEALDFWASHLRGVQSCHFPNSAAVDDALSGLQKALRDIEVKVPDTARVRRGPVHQCARLRCESESVGTQDDHEQLKELQEEHLKILRIQRLDVDNIKVGDVALRYVEGEDPTGYNITVNVADNDHGFTVHLGYLASRLSPEHAANISDALSAAISSIVSDPQSTTSFEMERDLPPTVNECIHVLVERSAAAAPDAPAVASWDGEFSYAELNRHANQLARVLAEMGFSRKNLILICFEKSSCAAVAMLGILKAGAGFVPLDPALPPERISAIIAQTGSSLALVSASTSKRIVNLVSRTLVVWVASNMWLGSDDMVIGSASPRNIAYTIFTSGSTGVAKGVVIEHSAVPVRRLYICACILEIFTTLVYGGCICIPSEEERMSDIAGSISRLQANTTFLTPSVVRILWPNQVPSLTTIILGGEALDAENIATWVGARNDICLINGYGPTETCVFCVMHTFTSKTQRHDVLGRTVSSRSWIGRPENHNHLAPVGSIGELLVEGGTVARGYVGDEEKSSQSFLSNHEAASRITRGERQADPRFHKTSDLVRYNTDGTISYIGRKDRQIKLRGQRIELSEIEHQNRDSFHPTRRLRRRSCFHTGRRSRPFSLLLYVRPTRMMNRGGSLPNRPLRSQASSVN
ncbi:hypothetical protein AN9243.2 [Aspergillus nidulans FGSC A4]|uniref:NRPS-like enzyme, putative (JCVI) n=1 Tax=Emericella nidulans (strain FGSC A4 / ATCC 38163 / CBS 112.46 / NRRL 194 / M139) TaxID=227321 RepID=Q5AR37_EMENI|nr:hypothetical protein [Aspergillus nidulans FGSC A4]EAA66310.1 hypothetical protein AN9243.2 [Aspergillus nidulans FGSC A4]CBF87235.1 TPA: NRPS-like enzyme, putative (JCVI) [Aspergillus nidulans FGSC A4]|eukprot:XP_682512.1 hypothetical protein AN9243.2 [Aspergillus nidulans FGSC A4]